MEFFLIQLLGLIPSVALLLAMQSPHRSRVLVIQLCCNILWGIHYGLLSAWTGVVINLFGILRAVVCYYNDRSWAKSKLWLAFFVVAYAVSPLLTWDGPYCLLLGLAMVLTSIALWSHNMRLTRLLFLCNSPPIFLYNLFAGSYSSVIIEIFAFCSFVIAIWRFDIKPNRKKTN